MSFEGISSQFPTGSPEISARGLVLSYDMRTLARRGALRDFSGKGNDGAVEGTHVVPGPFGPALGFRTASDYIGLPSARALHARGAFTIAVWLRFTGLGVHQHILSYDDLYSLWIDENDRFRFSDTRGDAFESDPGIVSTQRWCALVATFNGRRGTRLNGRNIALYVNDCRAPGRAFGIWNPGRPVEGYVAKESHEGQFYLPFFGDIAAVLLFRRPLSSEEARAFAHAPSISGESGSLWSGEATRVRPELGTGRARPTSPGPVRAVQGDEGPSWSRNAVGGTRTLPRVVRITNLLPPYRLPVLDLLEASPWLQFETWLMASAERNRRWTPPRSRYVRVFRDWGLDFSHRDMFTAHFNPGMIRELSDHPPDLVILGGYEQPTCLALSFLLGGMGIPFLLSSESTSLGGSLVGQWAPSLVRKLVSRSAGVIVPGRASREHLLELGASNDRIFVAPNAVDVERFSPVGSPEEKQALRAALGLPAGTVCLYVGRLTESKGLPDLIQAFRSVQRGGTEAHLLVVGEGRLRAKMESWIENDPSLRGRVRIVGYAPEEALPEYYRAADIFVFPTRRDVWGLVLNEAMSSGLPTVSSDGAAAALDMVEDGISGTVVPRGDPRALEAALAELCNDPDLRERMGDAARERVLARFTPRHQATGFLRAIETTLARVGRVEGDLPELEVQW
ncbi:MAG: glycosyltransferase [Methanobacteriota archaeon]|nr:MAG: glycosyltransferase [Euryarchaeota archaeon]